MGDVRWPDVSLKYENLFEDQDRHVERNFLQAF